MRICQVMLSSGFGGAERLFVDACLCLADRGHQILAVCHPRFEALAQLEHQNIEIFPLTVHYDWSYLAKTRLVRAMRGFRPVVIHSHLARGGAVAGAASRSEGIPVAANMHNYVKLKYYKHTSHFIPGTVDQKRYLEGKGVPSDQITVIPHFSRMAVAPEIGSPKQNSGTCRPTLVSYGRFVRKKGFHVLLESIAVLRERGLCVNLILGGDGPERENLVQQIADSDLEDQVTLYGWVDDVETFLAQSSYFVLPSLDEPFGIVILEAMARGKVIISSAAQGPREILDDSSAYLVAPGDPDALGDAIQTAIERVAGSGKKAACAWDVYQHCYTPDVIMPLYEKIFGDLVG